MFKATVRLDGEADVPNALRAFCDRLNEANLGPDGEQLREQVESIVQSFAASAARISTVGGQFSAERVLQGSGYHVTVIARYGQKPSLATRLSRMLRQS